MPFSVEAAVDRYVEELEEARGHDGLWHPSGLFGCPRKAVYDYLGVDKDEPDARAKRIFRLGHMLHEFVQTAIAAWVDSIDPGEDGLVLFLPEVKVVDPELGVKGHADGLGLYADGHWELFEFKSINSNAFKYGDLPKDDHRKQPTLYAGILRRLGGTWKVDGPRRALPVGGLGLEAFTDEEGDLRLRIPPLPDLTRMQLVYVSKDDMQMEAFPQLWTPEKEAWIGSYLERLQRHADEGTLPHRLPNKTLPSGNISPTQRDYRCSYCPFAARCWNVDKEGVA